MAAGFAAPLAVGLGLMASQRVPKPIPAGDGLVFDGILRRDRRGSLPLIHVPMRDGWDMPVSVANGPEDGPLIIALHGSGWCGIQFDGLGRCLSAHATVMAPDLRGHGAKPQRRGDVDYIGQLEDDLADLIAAKAKPGQKVILLGHSSGGGLVVRMAGGKHRQLMDGAVLLAPFLGHRAPTTRPNSGGWAEPMVRRLIGLGIWNSFRIRLWNHLPVIWFRFPQAVLSGPFGALATQAYSFRLNTSYAPRWAYQKDIAGLPPFLLLAGEKDEAFLPEVYGPHMSGLTDKGSYDILPGYGHLEVVDAPETVDRIRDWLNAV
jgi:pimeloyl-ACP methyl ester carboxylesterase